VDPRFDLPSYSRAEVSLHLGLPATTLGHWLRSGALEAVESPGRGEATITFAGLVETHMLRQLRQAGLSLQAIGDAAVALRSKAGRHYPLAWQGLAHDGRDLLIEIAAEGRDPAWERIRDSQGGLPGVVRRGSAAVGWADDGYAATLRLVVYSDVDVLVDPLRSSGQPILEGAGIRVEDVVDHARAGEPYHAIAAKFGLEDFEVEALVRPHIRPAPARRRLHTDDPDPTIPLIS
jgi:uncharacterized protein (DUF433 family)